MKEKYTKFKNKTFDDPRVFDIIRGILLGGYRHMFSRVKKYSEYEDGDSVKFYNLKKQQVMDGITA